MINFNVFNEMNIHQVYISKSLHHFSRIKELYGLIEYQHSDEPLLVFGMYDFKDYHIVKHHKGTVYMLWGGSDLDPRIKKSMIYVNKISKLHNIFHIAISNDMANRMKNINMTYILINFTLADPKIFKPTNNNYSHNIYIYNGFSKGKEWIYGKKYYEKVIKKLPEFNYITSNELNVPYQKMPSIYSKCFIGLRLTKYDGNANTVQEFNLMNIPIIHNGADEKCIGWSKSYDIIHNIIKINTGYFISGINKNTEYILVSLSNNVYDVFRHIIVHNWLSKHGYNIKSYSSYKNKNMVMQYINHPDNFTINSDHNNIVNTVNNNNIPIIYFGIPLLTGRIAKDLVPDKVKINQCNKKILILDNDQYIDHNICDTYNIIYSSNLNYIKKYKNTVHPLHCTHLMIHDDKLSIYNRKKFKYIIVCMDFSPISNHLNNFIINNAKNNIILFGNNIDKYINYGHKMVPTVDCCQIAQFVSESKYFLSDDMGIISIFRTICLVHDCKIKYFDK